MNESVELERHNCPDFWPGKATAAISLSYDDGLPNNLDRAIPDLNHHGIRGTFYLTVGDKRVRKRKEDWRRAFQQGHEIGNHTVRHPCRADAYTHPPLWLPRALRLENWSPEDIAREISEAAEWLNEEIGADPGRTFAHPCGATSIGIPPDEVSYDAAIQRHHFAARAGIGEPNDPSPVDLMRIRGHACDHPELIELIAYCDRALRTGGWAVLIFHSIGGRRFKTRHSVHKELLNYLGGQRFWIAPVRDVVSHILKNRRYRTS
jgi:peptidoglycan/xylan/chitin deacetylase (PgdA/CDA1 family)